MVNIKVAVRIRPSSFRERVQRDTTIVKNNDSCIFVTNPKMPEKNDGADSRQRVRKFAVDYCYDPAVPEKATQEAVFEEIGGEVLDSMFTGYNACVLAYGHSASGKTYTMMGTSDEPGLTPRICQGLCQRMCRNPGVTYSVSISFLEIYNEKVRDLLVDEDPSQPPTFSLRVREHPKLGPYVQDLSEHIINDEDSLLRLLNHGNSRRSTAATESNIHSSRSHAVFTINVRQIGDDSAKTSKVHLVDLAGSERASAIQSRTRLKEGANINKSLVTLGNVISALADGCDPLWGKGWQPFVPYRDSVLTWLLKDTLGGNSNTIMIATISPASSCYSDTINTLRYAKRTKSIVNQPVVNEDPKVRTIRELRDEVTRLKTMLDSFTSNHSEDSKCKEEEEEENVHSSKWQQARATQCAVGMQTDDWNSCASRGTSTGETMETFLPNDLIDNLEVTNGNQHQSNTTNESLHRNIATLDILPNSVENKQYNELFLKYPHQDRDVSEINAENVTGVNRVIGDPEQLPEPPYKRSEGFPRGNVWRGDVPRVSRTTFKRRRVVLRRLGGSVSSSPLWNMLHRSRPDLIKGISSRPSEQAPNNSNNFVDALSQSTSENSLHSSGSVDSPTGKLRSRQGPSNVILSRTSSTGDASGSSTPTQLQKPTFRKKENKRAEIVASVTSRLYAIKKKPDPRLEALQTVEKEDEDDDELEELKLCKRARMKLFDLSRKLAMTKKLKRTVDSDTQTEWHRSTLRVKEKCIATEQQGIVHFLTSSTNTPLEQSAQDPELPLVMNHVVFPNAGNFILECGPNLRVQVPSVTKSESSSQTNPICRDRGTSPKKINDNHNDEECSEDSLESDVIPECTRSMVRRKRLTKFKSYPLFSSLPPNDEFNAKQLKNSQFFLSEPGDKKNYFESQIPLPSFKRSIDSILDSMKSSGVRIEKSLKPISRYNINGTNAFYEYDPNISIADKVIYSTTSKNVNYDPGMTPKVLYHQYTPEDTNIPLVSEESLISNIDFNDSRKFQDESEENLSSGTSFVSTASSAQSDTSSDDFVFIENTNNTAQEPQTNRELYTISENSESCSKESTPLTSRSPRMDDIREESETEIVEPKINTLTDEMKLLVNEQKSRGRKNEPQSEPKKLNWAQLSCTPNRQFHNFNFTSSQFHESKNKALSAETAFPSEDSITFVFLGPKEKQTSVLLEMVKRSLAGSLDDCNTKKHSSRYRSRGIQCSSKLLRSVSVDTAMIALSRLSRNQRSASDVTRTNSMTTLLPEEYTEVVSDIKAEDCVESSIQCEIYDKVDVSTEMTSFESSCQCNFVDDKLLKYSSSTNTTNDKETETDVETKKISTQTSEEAIFDDIFPELPRRTMSSTPEPGGSEKEQNINYHWKELKQLILGTSGDLFPNYLSSQEADRPKKSRKPQKSVSWSDFSDETGGNHEKVKSKSEEKSESEREGDLYSQTRKVRFSEPQQKEITDSSSAFRNSELTISNFLREATSLLQSMNETRNTGADTLVVNEANTHYGFSTSSLLRRRNKILPRISFDTDNRRPLIISEASVQTEVEKTNQITQTGGLASSLVGPPVRRSLTPILRRDERDELTSNMTWPRRRISGKPPTGLKLGNSARGSTPGRSGSISSKMSTSSTSWSAYSPTNSALNSPMRQSPIRHFSLSPDPRGVESSRQVQESCRRLEMAIERDRERQKNFRGRMQSWFPNENVLVGNNNFSNDNGEITPERLTRNYTPRTTETVNRSSSIKSNDGFNLNYNGTPQFNFLINDVDQEFSSTSTFRSFHHQRDIDHLPKSQFLNKEVEITSRTSSISSPNPDYNSIGSESVSIVLSEDRPRELLSEIRKNVHANESYGENSPRICSPRYRENLGQRSVYPPVSNELSNECLTPASPISVRVFSRASCHCNCHKLTFSCGELSLSRSVRHCHACCTPCTGDEKRPYNSEPVLSSLETSHPIVSLSSPSAYLRHLISLRRGIVAAQKI